jgi:hypothetical protein
MLHSALAGMTTVDAFLMTQALLPDRGLGDADGSMGTFVTKLVAQMLPPVPLVEPSVATPGSAHSNGTSSSSSTSTAPPPLPMGLNDMCVCSNGLDMPLFSRGTNQAGKNDLWMRDVPRVCGPAARKMKALNDPRRPRGGVLTARVRARVTPTSAETPNTTRPH